MQGALLLGSVGMQFVQTQARRDQFIKFMRLAVGDLVRETTGLVIEWPEGTQPAPEHERAGHG